MYVRLNARNQIVEATDISQGAEYTYVPGMIADNMPLGLLGNNGVVNTPYYKVVDGAVVARTQEDMARDPYSDEPENKGELEERVTNVEDDVEQIIIGLEGVGT